MQRLWTAGPCGVSGSGLRASRASPPGGRAGVRAQGQRRGGSLTATADTPTTGGRERLARGLPPRSSEAAVSPLGQAHRPSCVRPAGSCLGTEAFCSLASGPAAQPSGYSLQDGHGRGCGPDFLGTAQGLTPHHPRCPSRSGPGLSAAGWTRLWAGSGAQCRPGGEASHLPTRYKVRPGNQPCLGPPAPAVPLPGRINSRCGRCPSSSFPSCPPWAHSPLPPAPTAAFCCRKQTA